jgi:protein-disulfide isomerase
VDNGTVRFVWYDYPLVEIHANAMLAARAGRCANDQNQFWAYHDVMFANQAQWSEVKDPAGQFIRYAQDAGLDRAAFSQCLRSDRFQREVSESRQLGSTLGVSGTPTLFVNGKRVQETPGTRAEWDAVIRQETGGAQAPAAAPAGTTPGAAAPADSAAG